MTESPPTNPADPSDGTPDDAARSVQEQLDHLLTQIETEEPGTLDPAVLPKDFKPTATEPEPPAATNEADAVVQEAMASFEAALDTDTDATTDTAASAEPDPPADDTESQMLADINAALLELSPDAEAEPDAELNTDDAPAEQVAAEVAEVTDAAPPADAPSVEQQLAQEIDALLSEPLAEAEPAPAEEQAVPTDTAAQPAGDAEPSLEDQLASEIQGLLDSTPDEQTEIGEQAEPTDGDPSIDELDRMLADEIDEDDELVGDFESVEAITAGIDTGEPEPPAVDEHAATASDVAAELDNQPEDLAGQAADEAGALEAVGASAGRDEDANEAEHGWGVRLAAAKEGLLRGCFALNWPARRFLTDEWRANLGYIALLNLFVGVAVWVFLIFR